MDACIDVAAAANIAVAVDVTIASASVEGRPIAPTREPVHGGTVADADIAPAKDVTIASAVVEPVHGGIIVVRGTQSWQ